MLMKSAYFVLICIAGVILPLRAQGTTPGSQFFDDSYVHTIHLRLEQPRFWDSLIAMHQLIYDSAGLPTGPKNYLQASVTIDGNALPTIGVRLKGFSSFFFVNGVKKPFKLDFNRFVADQMYDGLKCINLQNSAMDPTFMRDGIAYKLLNRLGIPAPRTCYVKLYVNNRYWGLYYAAEEVDDIFLNNRFKTTKGNLFKCIGWCHLLWQGDNYTAYLDELELDDKKSTTVNWRGFLQFLRIVNTPTIPGWSDSLKTVFAAEDFLKVLAFDIYSNNWDSYMAHGRNFYLWEDRWTKRFNWIPWDYNLSFSEHEFPLLPLKPTSPERPLSVNTLYQKLIPHCQNGRNAESKPLIENMLIVPSLKGAYLDAMCSLVNNIVDPAALDSFIDRTRNLIQSSVVEDSNKQFTTQTFLTGCERDTTIDFVLARWDTVTKDTIRDTLPLYTRGLKQFIRERTQTLREEIKLLPYTCPTTSTLPQNQKDARHTISPLLLQAGRTLIVRSSYTITAVHLYTIQGRKISPSPTLPPSAKNLTLDCGSLARGVYIVTIETHNGRSHRRVMIKNQR